MNKNFNAIDFSGTNEITDEGIKKHFKKVEPWEPLAELAWNGFDANASNVSVIVRETEAQGTESATVFDDGSGINFHKPRENFRRFNDSLKKHSYSTHGSQGRGRLAFHKICNLATWYTRFEQQDAKIVILSSNLSDIKGTTIPPSQQIAPLSEHSKGTCVELLNFHKNLPSEETLRREFSREFGWHLILMPDRTLKLNGVNIHPQNHEKSITTIKCDNYDFEVDLIQWNEKPKSEKSFVYLLSSTGVVVYSQLSSLNNKPDYYTSIYVKSPLFDDFLPTDDKLTQSITSFVESKTWKIFNKALNDFSQEHYANFLIKLADEQIEQYIDEGDFPDYVGMEPKESLWRLQHVKGIVKSIIINDPKLLRSSNKRQRKLIIRLLDKLSVSNENSGMLDVLESVLNLDAAAMSRFAKQIKKTKLDNIIQTIEILQNRELAINQLKEIMNVHYKDVLETPDLQKVIENNTWLFGPAYDILGAEEDSFTAITSNLRARINGINHIDSIDLDEDVEISGANRQVDLFLARKKPQLDSQGKKFFRCVIIEIKRPGISLNQKHLQQLDEYAAILSNYPEFSSPLTRFELILVGRKISNQDYMISSRLKGMQMHGESGLVTNDGKVKAYVKNWSTIFDEFELTNDYLLEKLKTQREGLDTSSKKELLEDLQSNKTTAQSA